MLASTSTWIDLASPDPFIARVSNQVLNQEIAYAAFCGISNVIIQGPLSDGRSSETAVIAQYARAIEQAIAIGPYLQLHISSGMYPRQDPGRAKTQHHLATKCRPTYTASRASHPVTGDVLSEWDAWDTIRSVCKYTSRVSIGMHNRKSPLNDLTELSFEFPTLSLAWPEP